ncbi:hypothetical protein HK102_005066, partial [Quaeritorhiza haematococci]
MRTSSQSTIKSAKNAAAVAVAAFAVGLAISASSAVVGAIKISEIQGDRWLSPFKDQTVNDITGIITAIPDAQRIWIQDPEGDGNNATSEAIQVFSPDLVKDPAGPFAVGDRIKIGSARVQEFNFKDANQNSVTQLTNPRDIEKLESNSDVFAVVKPVVLGGPNTPKNLLYDVDPFDIKVEQRSVESLNQPLSLKRGLDYYESLEGMLVQIDDPVAVSTTDRHGNVYVLPNRGKGATGVNSRGGITMNIRPDGTVDLNPEKILVAPGMNKAKTPSTVTVGDKLQPIVGILNYAFGEWRVLPYKTIDIAESTLNVEAPGTTLKGSDCGLVIGSYNVWNLNPSSKHFPKVAEQMVKKMNSPDIVALQEIQDNDGGGQNQVSSIVAADRTLGQLVDSIYAAGGPKYSYVQIDPVMNADGGEPNGNIRVAFLYNPERVKLVESPNGAGDAQDVQQVLVGNGKTKGAVLKYNPGRVDPLNPAWDRTRKPLSALFEFRGEKIFMINNHWSSKRGSSPTWGAVQPPMNSEVEKRLGQGKAVRAFIEEIIKVEPNARIVSMGDLNEYAFVAPVKELTRGGLMVELMDAKLPAEERYTYNFEGNCLALDHILVSKCLVDSAKIEPLHLNSWFPYKDTRKGSDHDPTVVELDFCNDACKTGATQTPSVPVPGQPAPQLESEMSDDSYLGSPKSAPSSTSDSDSDFETTNQHRSRDDEQISFTTSSSNLQREQRERDQRTQRERDQQQSRNDGGVDPGSDRRLK